MKSWKNASHIGFSLHFKMDQQNLLLTLHLISGRNNLFIFWINLISFSFNFKHHLGNDHHLSATTIKVNFRCWPHLATLFELYSFKPTHRVRSYSIVYHHNYEPKDLYNSAIFTLFSMFYFFSKITRTAICKNIVIANLQLSAFNYLLQITLG